MFLLLLSMKRFFSVLHSFPPPDYHPPPPLLFRHFPQSHVFSLVRFIDPFVSHYVDSIFSLLCRLFCVSTDRRHFPAVTDRPSSFLRCNRCRPYIPLTSLFILCQQPALSGLRKSDERASSASRVSLKLRVSPPPHHSSSPPPPANQNHPTICRCISGPFLSTLLSGSCYTLLPPPLSCRDSPLRSSVHRKHQ